uniref:NGR2 n=1 Tax=Oryza glumipatula TaxID=40148 RepID=A0A0D9Z8Q1_9ORYZ
MEHTTSAYIASNVPMPLLGVVQFGHSTSGIDCSRFLGARHISSSSLMGIVSWVQGRLGGRSAAAESKGLAAGNGNPPVVAAVVAAGKERKHQQVVHDDLAGDDGQQWPTPATHLFSIGTLGNDEVPEQGEEEEDLPEFSVEEVRKLQDALARLLLRARSKKYSEAVATAAAAAATCCGGVGGGADSGLPLDMFLNCPSSLEVDRRAQRDHGGGGAAAAAAVGLSPGTKMILTKAKDILADGNSRSTNTTTTTGDIKNKSFKFLLRKMFVCHGGFAPAPSLKDPTESSMEKFLRTVLGKKIAARPSNSPASRTYFLEGNNAHGDDHRLCRRRRPRRGEEEEEEEEEENKGEESCKWDRTDSEYIVLEI